MQGLLISRQRLQFIYWPDTLQEDKTTNVMLFNDSVVISQMARFHIESHL